MNVTFSCKVLSRWAQLVSVFSRMFKFSRIVIYRAKSRRSVLEWKYLLILFNRNNCSLSVGVFSFSLIWQSIAAQFLTFVRKGEQIFVEKDSPSSTTTKSSFFSRSANFGNVSLTHKIANCACFEILQFIRSKSITECIKFPKRVELWTDFWQLDDIFESPGRNKLIVWKTASRFFSPSSHALRFARVRLLRHALPISLLILRKKKMFCSLPLHGKKKFSFLGLPTLITRCHFVNLTSFKIISSLFSSSSEASTWLELLGTHAQLTQPAWAKRRANYCHWTPHNI